MKTDRASDSNPNGTRRRPPASTMHGWLAKMLGTLVGNEYLRSKGMREMREAGQVRKYNAARKKRHQRRTNTGESLFSFLSFGKKSQLSQRPRTSQSRRSAGTRPSTRPSHKSTSGNDRSRRRAMPRNPQMPAVSRKPLRSPYGPANKLVDTSLKAHNLGYPFPTIQITAPSPSSSVTSFTSKGTWNPQPEAHSSQPVGLPSTTYEVDRNDEPDSLSLNVNQAVESPPNAPQCSSGSQAVASLPPPAVKFPPTPLFTDHVPKLLSRKVEPLSVAQTLPPPRGQHPSYPFSAARTGVYRS